MTRAAFPFAPAEAGARSWTDVLGPWVPAFAGTNGESASHSHRFGAAIWQIENAGA
jgi:hypothetical protein